MSSKEKILELLEKNRGHYVSGAVLAEQFGISRNAIWKAINDLRSKGYAIDAIPNKGYQLIDNGDIISKQGILAFWSSSLPVPEIQIHSCLESTNRTAKELAIAGALHGTTIIANTQTGGRGHNGESFVSPDGGLYMSVILDPNRLPISEPSHISALSAVSVCKTIAALTTLTPEIKLVTDIFANGEKICGILSESAFDFETNQLQWIVVGIGIPHVALGQRNEFAASILVNLLDPQIGDSQIIDYYKKHHR